MLKLRNFISWKSKMHNYWNRIKTSNHLNIQHKSQIIQLTAKMEFQLLILKMIMILMTVHLNKSTWVMPRKRVLIYQTLFHRSNSSRRKKRLSRKSGSMMMIQLQFFQQTNKESAPKEIFTRIQHTIQLKMKMTLMNRPSWTKKNAMNNLKRLHRTSKPKS